MTGCPADGLSFACSPRHIKAYANTAFIWREACHHAENLHDSILMKVIHMFKIGISTKDKRYESHIRKLLEGIISGCGDVVYESIPVEVLCDRKSERFLDVSMFVLDDAIFREEGVETVDYLYRIRPDASIIFFEGVKEQSVSGVRYHVYAYNLKRLKQQELKAEIMRKLNKDDELSRCITIRSDGEQIMVPVRYIMYFESRNRHIILHTTLSDYEYNEKMYVVEELLADEGFLRCHQSYIVSKRYITGYDSNGIWMDQELIPVGRKYKERVDRELVYENIGTDDNEDIGGVTADKKSEKQGVLVGVKGIHEGAQFHFRPEKKLLIGRDEKTCDIVLNMPLVSRLHCIVVYHEADNMYELVDVSKNGTYLKGRKRLAPDTDYCLKPGTELSFGGTDNVYRLG